MKEQKGQSIVELVFAIGVVALVMTGVVILLVNSFGARNKSFDRKKAVELAEIVTEDLVNWSKNDFQAFWNVNSNPPWNFADQTNSDFPGYTYRLDHEWSAECTPNTDCAVVNIKVIWQRDEEKSIDFYRFFSKR
jgi:type II secretory pathway pseudopilin PulG